MKVGPGFILGLALAAGGARAQQQGLETVSHAPDSSATFRSDIGLAPLVTAEKPAIESDVIVRKNLQVSGPLVRPLKAKKFRELPRRLLHWVNPFASSEHQDQKPRLRGLSRRAWTTTVGWNSAGLGFPNEANHEPTMSLLSVSGR